MRFWNFPETAWRVTNHRQATHANSCILGSRKRNRLAALSRFADEAPGGTG